MSRNDENSAPQLPLLLNARKSNFAKRVKRVSKTAKRKVVILCNFMCMCNFVIELEQVQL